MPRVKRVVRSFACALAGLAYAVRTQRNMRIHLFLAFTAWALALYLRLSPLLLLVLILAVTMVLAAELFNTALEAAVDLYGTAWRPLAKVAKDAAAGAVLVTAVSAAGTGLFLFWPRLAALAPLGAAVLRTIPAVAAAAGISLLVRPLLPRVYAPSWGVAGVLALGTGLAAAGGLFGPAVCLVLAGLVPVRPAWGWSAWGGAVAGVLAGLLTAHLGR